VYQTPNNIHIHASCVRRLTPADKVVEVSGPLVDHASILSHPAGLNALDGILYKLGVPHENPVTHLLKNLIVP
jgi:hypothetical protein